MRTPWVLRPARAGFFCGVLVVGLLAGCSREPKALYDEADRLWLAEKYRTALEKYQQIVDGFPKSSWADRALYRMGELYFLFLNDPERAVDSFKELISNYPNSDLAFSAQEYVATLYEQYIKNYDQAIVEYQKLIDWLKGKKGADRFQLAIAECYYRKGEISQAITEYQMLLEEYPGSSWREKGRYQLANALNVLGRNEEAVKEYRKFLRDYPNSVYTPDAKLGLAGSLEDMGRLKEALAVYKDLKGDPDHQSLIAEHIANIERQVQYGPHRRK